MSPAGRLPPPAISPDRCIRTKAFPANSVPAVVRAINAAFSRADQIQTREGAGDTYLVGSPVAKRGCHGQALLTGERTGEGYLGYKGGLEAAIARACVPYADLLWHEPRGRISKKPANSRKAFTRSSLCRPASCPEWGEFRRGRFTAKGRGGMRTLQAAIGRKIGTF
jgi:Isocitrate lyase family